MGDHAQCVFFFVCPHMLYLCPYTHLILFSCQDIRLCLRLLNSKARTEEVGFIFHVFIVYS